MINLFIVDMVTSNNDNGVKTYISELIRGIQRQKHFNLSLIKINMLSIGEYSFKTKSNISIHEFPMPFVKLDVLDNDESSKVYYSRILDILEEKLTGLKNLVFHFNWIDHSYFALLVKKRFTCRTILTRHCIPWKTLISSNFEEYRKFEAYYKNNGNKPGLVKKFVVEREGYTRYDKIITVTQLAKQDLEKLFDIFPSRICTIYNGLQTRRKRVSLAQKQRLKNELGFNDDEKVILFVGRQEKLNGFLLFLKHIKPLLSANRKIKIVIVGHIDPCAILQNCGHAWANIVFTDHISHEQLSKFYLVADIGIIPSLYEQCSYVALEMMHYSLPIIAFDVDGLKEIVKNKQTGFSIPLSYGANSVELDGEYLRNVLLLLLVNFKIRRDLGRNAYQHFLENFTADSMVDSTIKAYRDVVFTQPEIE